MLQPRLQLLWILPAVEEQEDCRVTWRHTCLWFKLCNSKCEAVTYKVGEGGSITLLCISDLKGGKAWGHVYHYYCTYMGREKFLYLIARGIRLLDITKVRVDLFHATR